MPRIPNAYHMAPLDAETLDVSTHEEVDSNPSQDHASPRSTRPPSLAMDPRHPSIRILNSLTPETCSRTEDVGLTASIPENRVPKSAAVLVQAKAVVLFMVGGRSYAALTASGAKHLSYDKSAEKAPVADLQADYGTPRTVVSPEVV